jgi:hypothetical protein
MYTVHTGASARQLLPKECLYAGAIDYVNRPTGPRSPLCLCRNGGADRHPGRRRHHHHGGRHLSLYRHSHCQRCSVMVDLNLDELFAKQLSPNDISNALNLQNLVFADRHRQDRENRVSGSGEQQSGASQRSE